MFYILFDILIRDFLTNIVDLLVEIYKLLKDFVIKY